MPKSPYMAIKSLVPGEKQPEEWGTPEKLCKGGTTSPGPRRHEKQICVPELALAAMQGKPRPIPIPGGWFECKPKGNNLRAKGGTKAFCPHLFWIK